MVIFRYYSSSSFSFLLVRTFVNHRSARQGLIIKLQPCLSRYSAHSFYLYLNQIVNFPNLHVYQFHLKAPAEKKAIVNQADDSIAFLQLFAKSDQGVAEVG